jgi:hypothetical protein
MLSGIVYSVSTIWTGTPTYKLQVKTMTRARIHAQPCTMQLRTLPPRWSGPWHYHVAYGSGARPHTKVGSGTPTWPAALDLITLPRWAPVLPHALKL